MSFPQLNSFNMTLETRIQRLSEDKCRAMMLDVGMEIVEFRFGFLSVERILAFSINRYDAIRLCYCSVFTVIFLVLC